MAHPASAELLHVYACHKNDTFRTNSLNMQVKEEEIRYILHFFIDKVRNASRASDTVKKVNGLSARWVSSDGDNAETNAQEGSYVHLVGLERRILLRSGWIAAVVNWAVSTTRQQKRWAQHGRAHLRSGSPEFFGEFPREVLMHRRRCSPETDYRPFPPVARLPMR